MNNKVKSSYRIIAIFLAINFLTTVIPVNQLFAGNNGPTSPEAVGFEPVDATDMVRFNKREFILCFAITRC